jgi:hypothetical protein
MTSFAKGPDLLGGGAAIRSAGAGIPRKGCSIDNLEPDCPCWLDRAVHVGCAYCSGDPRQSRRLRDCGMCRFSDRCHVRLRDIWHGQAGRFSGFWEIVLGRESHACCLIPGIHRVHRLS